MKFVKIIIPVLIVLAIIPILYVEKNNDKLIITTSLTDKEIFDKFTEISNTNWDIITSTKQDTNIYGINKVTNEIINIVVYKDSNYEKFVYTLPTNPIFDFIIIQRGSETEYVKGDTVDDFNLYEIKPSTRLVDEIPLGNLIPLVLVAGLLTYLYVGVKQGKDE